MEIPTNQHSMLKLPKGVKFRKDFVNAMNNHFEPSDLFIKLSWKPVEYPTKNHVLIPFLVALFADHVKGLIKEITTDIRSNQATEIKPKFMVLFEYGYNDLMHAYILYELCMPDKYSYEVDFDWYTKKWNMPNYLHSTGYQCISNIINVPRLLNEVIGLSNTKKKFYITENLTNPMFDTDFNNTGFVIESYSDYYEMYGHYINAW